MASTNWKNLYPLTLATTTGAAAILTVPVNQSNVITKFTVSNITGTAALGIIEITPAGGTIRQVWSKIVPGSPTMGGVIEVVELEGQILGPGDVVTFTAGTANALCPMISGVAYTQ